MAWQALVFFLAWTSIFHWVNIMKNHSISLEFSCEKKTANTFQMTRFSDSNCWPNANEPVKMNAIELLMIIQFAYRIRCTENDESHIEHSISNFIFRPLKGTIHFWLNGIEFFFALSMFVRWSLCCVIWMLRMKLYLRFSWTMTTLNAQLATSYSPEKNTTRAQQHGRQKSSHH